MVSLMPVIYVAGEVLFLWNEMIFKKSFFVPPGAVLLFLLFSFFSCDRSRARKSSPLKLTGRYDSTSLSDSGQSWSVSDTAAYQAALLRMVHNKPSAKWPVRTAYPLAGAILPFKRIVTYYGNFYSAGMGILGELPPDKMLDKLKQEVKNWELADSLTPVQPALQYIAVTAQRKPGKDKRYRLRMPFSQVDKAISLAAKINAIVILDVQVGHSSLQQELPPLLEYLKQPGIHLAIDPEYSMKHGEVPCSVIGTFDAEDINYASQYLAGIVRRYQLPPKILVVHRFTRQMVTNYKKINTCGEVQIVMDMDGFGFPAKKVDSYKAWISNEPVQFTGFKLFYKNDPKSAPDKRMMTPAEILKLYPRPLYIHYQ
jgi:hypothetical protein